MSRTTLFLEWGQGLTLTTNGSLQLATGWDAVRQLILRRLLTSPQQIAEDGTPIPADYIYDPTYGVGVRQRIGGLVGQRDLEVLRQQVLQGVMLDSGVDPDHLPTIVMQQFPQGMVAVYIEVVLATGERGQVSIALT
jgi:hypothetical protein